MEWDRLENHFKYKQRRSSDQGGVHPNHRIHLRTAQGVQLLILTATPRNNTNRNPTRGQRQSQRNRRDSFQSTKGRHSFNQCHSIQQPIQRLSHHSDSRDYQEQQVHIIRDTMPHRIREEQFHLHEP